MTSDGGQEGNAAGPRPAPTPRRRLDLDDPMPTRAGEDRPESWGEQAESDTDRLRFYQQQRPPHHGS